jgi:hypothetical protein
MVFSVFFFFGMAYFCPSPLAVGDRTHIPDYAQPAYSSISEHLNRMRQTIPVRPFARCSVINYADWTLVTG